ncbi:MAG: EAL domain-containing protein [Planctomycetaceae bacterium]|nr:EAL domain-containing protein [Planctomycetaceae bacterium]
MNATNVLFDDLGTQTGLDTGWFLFGSISQGDTLSRVPVNSPTFKIGRRSEMDLTLRSPRVSGEHAEIILVGETIFIRDLGSRNGTFVNRRRVDQVTPIGEGDHIELADMEFRIEYRPSKAVHATSKAHLNDTMDEIETLESAWVLSQLDELIGKRAVVPHYQVIMGLMHSSPVGYEALARSSVSGLENPGTMFETAKLADREAELSLLCRAQAVELGVHLPKGSSIFLNTHPAESLHEHVLPSLRHLRTIAPEHTLVVEIHEGAIDDLSSVRRFIDELKDHEIGIAYDDFGSGRSRLVELIQAPPNFLKFDIGLIRDIHKSPKQQQRMLKILVEMVHDMGTRAVAEGVEKRHEAECCRDLGFDYLQGYFFGRPKPVDGFLPQTDEETGTRTSGDPSLETMAIFDDLV